MKHIRLTLTAAIISASLTALPASADRDHGHDKYRDRVYLIKHDGDHRYRDDRRRGGYRRNEIHRPHPAIRPHITLSIDGGKRFDRFDRRYGHGYSRGAGAWNSGFKAGYREGYRDAKRKFHHRSRRH